MRKKRRNKQRKLILITSISLLFILTVGYAAFQTNLNISAKGNIVKKGMTPLELRSKYCNTTSGDGLYKDVYETDRCIYKGSNPDNYIKFNNDLFRIISIESDGSLKIMKKDSVISMRWDVDGGVWGSNKWDRPALINTYLNTTYYNSLSNEAKDLITDHVWPVGLVVTNNNDLSAQIELEKSIKWNGKIGLINVSDYIRLNSNVEVCGNYSLTNTNYVVCSKTNFILPLKNHVWMINARDLISDTSSVVTRINSSGTIGAESAGYSESDVLPVMYLDPSIVLYGLGTADKPYTIN